MTGMRLGIRLVRGELLWSSVVVALVAGYLALAAIVVAGIYAGTPACDADRIGAACAGVAEAMRPWEQAGQLVVGSLWVLPFVLGALLGVAVTAGELEHRTAHLAWTLDGSRVRWFLVRVVPVAVWLALLLGAAALAAEGWTRARLVTDQPGFVDYALRSLLVPLHALLAYAVGLATGITIGRVLPALLVAIGFTLTINAGLLALFDIWHTSQATFVTLASLDRLAYPLIAHGGVVVPGPGGIVGALQIPVGDFAKWVVVESAGWAAACLAVGWLAMRIVRHRRPT